MARRPAHYGSAQIKKREPVRPLLVLSIIVAGGILLFLWLQEDTVDPVMAVAEDPVAEEPAAPEPRQPAAPTVRQEDDLTDWWYDAESALYDAFRSMDDARAGSCSGLEYALSDLGSIRPRQEQQIRASFSAVFGALDSALAGCRDGNAPAVSGAEASAKAQLKSLLRSLEGFGVPPSNILSDI